MINSKIFDLADQLKSVVNEQKKAALDAIGDLPDGETKTALQELLRKATSGKVAYQDVQKELQKIVKNAG